MLVRKRRAPSGALPHSWNRSLGEQRRRSFGRDDCFPFCSYRRRRSRICSSASSSRPCRREDLRQGEERVRMAIERIGPRARSSASRARRSAFADCAESWQELCLAPASSQGRVEIVAACRFARETDPVSAFVVASLLVERVRELCGSCCEHCGLLMLLRRACRSPSVRSSAAQGDRRASRHAEPRSRRISVRGHRARVARSGLGLTDLIARASKMPTHRLEPAEPRRGDSPRWRGHHRAREGVPRSCAIALVDGFGP